MEQNQDQQNYRDDVESIDEFTGLLSRDKESEALRKDLGNVVSQAEALRILQETSGWGILTRFIDAQVSWMTDSLKVERDIEKIRRLQAEVLAFESLQRIIEKSFYDAEEAKKKLLDIVSGSA